MNEEIYPPIPSEPTSVRIRRILESINTEWVPVEYLVMQLHRRSFGGLFLIFGIIALLPGISFFAGLAMLVPAAQLAAGYRFPVLPRFVRRRELNTATILATANNVLPRLERLERFIKPRWQPLTEPPVINIAGIMILVLSLVIMLPMPLSNVPPAIAVNCIALGLLGRDGRLLAIGLAMALLALLIGVFVAYLTAGAITLLIDRYV